MFIVIQAFSRSRTSVVPKHLSPSLSSKQVCVNVLFHVIVFLPPLLLRPFQKAGHTRPGPPCFYECFLSNPVATQVETHSLSTMLLGRSTPGQLGVGTHIAWTTTQFSIQFGPTPSVDKVILICVGNRIKTSPQPGLSALFP